MGDDAAHVEAVFQHRNHLVPGLEDLAPIDALDGDRLEHDARPVHRRLARRDAEHGDAPAHHQTLDHLVERALVARHLEPDVEALLHPEARHHLGEVLLGHVDRHHVGDAGGEREAVGVDVGDDDMARADMARHRRRHDADRPRAGDQHVLAHQIEAERGMHRVAQGIEDRADLVIDRIREGDHVERRKPQVFGEGARLVDADAAGFGVEVKLARPALARMLADQVPLAGAALPDLEIGHVGPQLDDLAREFVARHQRHRHRALRPLVPVPDMHVGAADAGLVDPDQHVVGADLGHRHRLAPQPRLGPRLDQSGHAVGAAHSITPSSRPACAKASSAASRSSRVRAAFIWVRIRAAPLGTTGKKKAET